MRKDSKDAIMGISLLMSILYFTFPVIKDIPDRYTLPYYLKVIFGSISFSSDNAFSGIVAGVFQSLILTLPLLCFIYLVICGLIDYLKKRNTFKPFIPSIISFACNVLAVLFFLIMPRVKVSDGDKAFKMIFKAIFSYGEPCFFLYVSLILSGVILGLSIINILSKKKSPQ